MIGPDGQPPMFTGAAWVSRDGRYWWNGTAWQEAVKPKRKPNLVLIGIGIVIVAGVALAIFTIPRPTDSTPYGVTNAKIDSPTQIEFDYRAQTGCNTLTFDYRFYATAGILVAQFQDQEQSQVSAGRSYHFTITVIGQSIDTNATRFTADPICHD